MRRPIPAQKAQPTTDARRLRIALLTWDYPPAPTGLGRAAGEIAEGLAHQGHDVAVFTADREGTRRLRGVTVIGLPIGRSLRMLRRRMVVGHLALPLAFRRAVRAAHCKAAFDVIEATNWYAPAALLPIDCLPLIVRNSTPAAETFERPSSPRDRIDLAFAQWLEARTARRADHLISNTDHHRHAIERAYGLSTDQAHTTIGLALDDDVIGEGRDAGYPTDGQPELLFVGRMERRKGFDELIGAVAHLHARADGGAPLLHIVGVEEGDVRRRIELLGLPTGLLSALRIHGRASDAEVRRLYGRVHAVAAPSRYESYGLVYREAAAFGRPLIACAEDPSAYDFLSRHPIGILAPDCSAPSIAAAISHLLGDAVLRDRCRKAGLAYARTLSRRSLARATSQVYLSVSTGERRGPLANRQLSS